MHLRILGLVRALAVLALASLGAGAAQAASDCFEPLRANAGWSCRGELEDGQVVDYCLERTSLFGVEPGDRSFTTVSTGPYSARCSCQAKGASPGAAFGADKSYLCLDRATDTVIRGKVSKRRMAGETFNVSANLRTTFRCEPNPACDVIRVVDPDREAVVGSVPLLPEGEARADVIAGGDVSIGYIPGCSGYASEAPTFVYRLGDAPPGTISLGFSDVYPDSEGPGVLVVTPSGAATCSYRVKVPAEPGPYRVWVRSATAGALLEGELSAYYLLP